MPGHVAADLVRVAVDDVLDEVGADPARVEERRALRGRPVGGDPRPVARELAEQAHQLLAQRGHPRAERAVEVGPVDAGLPLVRERCRGADASTVSSRETHQRRVPPCSDGNSSTRFSVRL